MNQRVYLASPHMSEEGYEQKYIQEAFDTNWIAPLGNNVTMFEKEVCDLVRSKEGITLSSGTAAIHLALKLAGVQEGDLVFCQSLTFVASVNPILYEKAIPIMIDSEEDTWNISVDALEEAFIKYEKMGQKPKAVVIVHIYGICAKVKQIKQLCEKYQVVLIEDAAESLGSTIDGQYTGTFGDYGIYSFNGNKIITTSSGGMLLCNGKNAKEDAQKARFWATQAREKERYYEHKEIGYNYRMSNITAGIGRGQLKVLHQRIEKKRQIYKRYQEGFQDIRDISLMPFDVGNTYQNCWLTTIVLNKDSKVTSNQIIDALEKENIESRPVWKPMHLQPLFKDCDYIDQNSVSQTLFEYGVCLPSDTKMTNEIQNRVIEIVKGLWKHV